MKTYFECHITFESSRPHLSQHDVDDMGWIFSRINGDPDLGSGVKCYATKQFHTDTPEQEIIDEMESVSDALVTLGNDVLRNKIEKIIYDKRMD